MKVEKSRDSDLPFKDLVFALRHRVCGTEKLVKVYICGSGFQDDHLLSYSNYADGTHPDFSQEQVLMESLTMRSKPLFTPEELVYLVDRVKDFVRRGIRKRTPGPRGSRGSESSAQGSASVPSVTISSANKRLLNKINTLDSDRSAIGVVRYNIEKGVGLKTVDMPHLQGTLLRYMLKPIPVVASHAVVYDHVLDVLYPDESASDSQLRMKRQAKSAMRFVIKYNADDKSIGPIFELDDVVDAMLRMEESMLKSGKSTGEDKEDENMDDDGEQCEEEEEEEASNDIAVRVPLEKADQQKGQAKSKSVINKSARSRNLSLKRKRDSWCRN